MVKFSLVTRLTVILSFFLALSAGLSQPACQCQGQLKGKIKVYGKGSVRVDGKSFSPSAEDAAEAQEEDIIIYPNSNNMVHVDCEPASGGGPGVGFTAQGCGWSLSGGAGYCGNCEEGDGEGPPLECEGNLPYCQDTPPPEIAGYVCDYSGGGYEPCPTPCVTSSCPTGGDGSCPDGSTDCTPKPFNEDVAVTMSSEEEDPGDTGGPGGADGDGGFGGGGGGGGGGQPFSPSSIKMAFNLGKHEGNPLSIGKAVLWIKPEAFGTTPFSNPDVVSLEPEVQSGAWEQIRQPVDSMTGQKQIISQEVLVDKQLVGADIVLRCYSTFGISLPGDHGAFVGASALTAARLFSTVTVKKTSLVFGSMTLQGIQVVTARVGAPASNYELYATPNLSGGGESVEVNGNRAVYSIVMPWVTEGGRTYRVETTEEYKRDSATGTFYKVGATTDTYVRLQKFAGAELVDERELLIMSTTGEGTDVRTSYWFYETSLAKPLWGRLLAEMGPDGSWVRYIRNVPPVGQSQMSLGTVKAIYRPWKNSGFGVMQASSPEAILAQIEAVPANACLVEEFSSVPSIQGNKMYVRLMKAAGNLIWREESQGVVLIDPVTGQTVRETRTRRVSGSNQVLSDNRRGALYNPTVIAGAPETMDGRLVYETNTDGTRTTYVETKATVSNKQQVTTKTIRGGAIHPFGLPNQGQMQVTVTLGGKTVSTKDYVQTGSSLESFQQVSQTTYSETMDGQIRVEHVFQDGIEIGTARYLVNGVVERTNEAGGLISSSHDEVAETSTETRDGGEEVMGDSAVLFSGADLVTINSTHPLSPVGGQPRAGYLSRTTVKAMITPSSFMSRVAQEYEYNILGELTRTTDAQGLVTNRTRTKTASGWSETESGPGIYSRTTLYYLDGRVRSITGTLVAEYYDYEYTSQGLLATTVRYAAADSPRWKRRYTDGTGRLVREEEPGYGDLTGSAPITTDHLYNGLGQLVKTRRSGKLQFGTATLGDELFEYDESGREVRRGTDLDSDGKLDLISSEPIRETIREFQHSGGAWWEVIKSRVYERQVANGYRESIQRLRLGDGPAQRQESYTPQGALTVTTVAVDRAQRKRTTRVQQADGNFQETVEINGLALFQTNREGQSTTGYSDFWEPVVTGMPNGALSRTYDSTGRLQSEIVTGNSQSRTTTYTYYPSNHDHAGKLQTVTAPYTRKFSGATSATSYVYDSYGRVVAQYGTGTYPVKFGFNSYGEQTSMTTYQSWSYTGDPSNVASWTGGTTTLWNVDSASGLLQSKEDAQGRKTVYAYYPGSRLMQSRTWARLWSGQPLKTEFYYDVAGRVISKSYSDDTTDISYSYRRDGSVEQVVDDAGAYTYGDWSADGQPQSQTVIGETEALAGLELKMPVDSLGRRIGYQGHLIVKRPSVANQTQPLPGATWSYDNVGRLSRITSGTRSTTFAYSSSGRTLTRQDTAAPALSLQTVESVSLPQGLYSISHNRSGNPVQSRAIGPVSNPGSQVNASINALDPDFGIGSNSGLSRWAYIYDQRGQVTKDEKQTTTDGSSYSALSARSTLRSFNAIGGTSGDNNLNQLTSRSHEGVWVDGLAQDTSGIEVNGNETTNAAPAWYGRFLDSGSQPQWASVNISFPNGASPNLERNGHLYVPPTVEALTYDEDGNLTGDARWQYTWDAENRLKTMSTKSAAVTAGVPEQRLTFWYDSQSRRVRKKVELKTGGTWSVKNDVRFVYDGWNLISEVEYNAQARDYPASGDIVPSRAYLLRSYVWGPDVSGTMTGAGGVGGLLMMTRHEHGLNAAHSNWTTMDLNGNIIGLMSTVNADRCAVYDYDGFGKCIRANEPEADLNSVLFSSKYTDMETGLSYYGNRYYSADMGRWIGRDPIQEDGGLNLYGMVSNDPVSKVDFLGLAECNCCELLERLQEWRKSGLEMVKAAEAAAQRHRETVYPNFTQTYAVLGSILSAAISCATAGSSTLANLNGGAAAFNFPETLRNAGNAARANELARREMVQLDAAMRQFGKFYKEKVDEYAKKCCQK